MVTNKRGAKRRWLIGLSALLLLLMLQPVWLLGSGASKVYAQAGGSPAGGSGSGDSASDSGGDTGAQSTQCQVENGHYVLDSKNPCVGTAPQETQDSATKNCQTSNKGGDSGNGAGDTSSGGNTDQGASGTPAQQVGCVNLVKKYLDPLVKLLSGLVAIFVAASIAVGGIQYSSSTGDPAKVAKAKKRIGEAVFALLAYLFMFAFLQWLVPGGIV